MYEVPLPPRPPRRRSLLGPVIAVVLLAVFILLFRLAGGFEPQDSCGGEAGQTDGS